MQCHQIDQMVKLLPSAECVLQQKIEIRIEVVLRHDQLQKAFVQGHLDDLKRYDQEQNL
jgi:hypothetical protein